MAPASRPGCRRLVCRRHPGSVTMRCAGLRRGVAVFDIAEQVQAWRAAGMPVVVARIVQTRGISSRDTAALAAFAPGAPPAGSLLSGAADSQLAALAAADPERAIVEVAVSDEAAATAGLSCGGTARVLLQPAAEVPDEAWTRVQTREPVCLVTELVDGSVGETAAFTPATAAGADARYGEPIARLFARGASVTRLLGDQPTLLVTALWPQPTLVVVGDGLIADALAAAASLLGWQLQVVNDAGAAAAAVGGLSSADAAVVLSHDRAVDGPSLQAALPVAPATWAPSVRGTPRPRGRPGSPSMTCRLPRSTVSTALPAWISARTARARSRCPSPPRSSPRGRAHPRARCATGWGRCTPTACTRRRRATRCVLRNVGSAAAVGPRAPISGCGRGGPPRGIPAGRHACPHRLGHRPTTSRPLRRRRRHAPGRRPAAAGAPG